jgi:pilus assembly protein FimV
LATRTFPEEHLHRPQALLRTLRYADEENGFAVTPGSGVRTLMAFGFGFNKQKALSAAEKYVQQGKIQNAIAEYEKVLKADPKDLTVSNTIGDLYSRLGDSDKATECFKTVGDAYATQGFTVKAIAMYKKISKLKPSLESVLKLAELYTQQGLFNDARSQYLQVAEEFLKANELENAVRIFQKILEMDPENTNMRIRLAEVYVRLNKKNDAWQIFSAAAETLRSKGSLGAAEEVLQRMLTLDPGNSYALLMQARNLLEAGDAEAAIETFKKVSDLDSNPDGLRDLLKAYLKTGRLSDAGTLASKLLAVHNDLAAISTFVDALMQAGQYENALQVYDQHAERLLAEDSNKVLKNLHSVIGHVRDNPACLEKLLELFQKAGETTHITEVIELLAHASVQSGDLVRARDLYQRLASMEPGNPLHMSNYQQVVSQLGGATAGGLISAEEAVVIVDELEATAPSIHQHYSDAVALGVRSALTDAELFISYNMPAKALGPLMTALPQAPSDLRLNQRLAALHTRASRFAEAGVCCRTLQSVYSEAGYPDEATRYGELAARYEERAAAPVVAETSVEPAAIAEAEHAASPWPGGQAEDTEFAVVNAEETSDTEPEAISAEAADAPDLQAASVEAQEPAEIDLSSEWDDAITIEAEEPAVESAEPAVPEDEAMAIAAQPAEASTHNAEKVAETIEEIRFYLEHGMPEQAATAFEKLQTVTSDQSTLQTLRAEIETASQQPAAEEEISAVESISEFAAEDVSVETAAVEVPVLQTHSASAPAEATSQEIKAVPEAEIEEPAPVAEAAQPGPPAHAPGVLHEFVADLESSLGDNFLPATTAHEAKIPAQAPAKDLAQAPSAAAHAEPAASGKTEASKAPLGEFVAALEASLGDDFLKGAPVAEAQAEPKAPVSAVPQSSAASQASPAVPAHTVTAAPAAAIAASAAASASASAISLQPALAKSPAPSAAASATAAAKASPFGEEAGIDLAVMFGELKQDLEAGATTNDEDPETHYNLGIAFREMGLLDEAIGELQKTCQAVDHGHAFPQLMQTYTWLAQCFLDKGVPQAAIRWYDKALTAPGVDEDTRTALHYELASAYETAGDKNSALKHFMEVYGRNIDYRDVAERIKPLRS